MEMRWACCVLWNGGMPTNATACLLNGRNYTAEWHPAPPPLCCCNSYGTRRAARAATSDDRRDSRRPAYRWGYSDMDGVARPGWLAIDDDDVDGRRPGLCRNAGEGRAGDHEVGPWCQWGEDWGGRVKSRRRRQDSSTARVCAWRRRW
ncbi:hypothetical protein ZWY2020_000530 [Hordeum vulgare]|nr:hypothetical protein ZWY2020_000530 [Hordeum vulgare]